MIGHPPVHGYISGVVSVLNLPLSSFATDVCTPESLKSFSLTLHPQKSLTTQGWTKWSSKWKLFQVKPQSLRYVFSNHFDTQHSLWRSPGALCAKCSHSCLCLSHRLLRPLQWLLALGSGDIILKICWHFSIWVTCILFFSNFSFWNNYVFIQLFSPLLIFKTFLRVIWHLYECTIECSAWRYLSG